MAIDPRQQTNPSAAAINRIPRGLHFLLFVTAMAWATAANGIASRSAQGIALRFQLAAPESFLESAFLLFLVIVGFQTLDWIATRGRQRADVLPLPSRPGWPGEWGLGAAIGWALALLAVLPLLLARQLHADFGWRGGSALAALSGIATLLLGTLAAEVVFRGYPFRRLSQAVGTFWAALLLSIAFAALIVQANPPRSTGLAMIDCTLLGLLLTLAWMRTHALWLGWGLHFAYRAISAVALGLPIAGQSDFGSPVNMQAAGPRWLTGGAFGLDAALFTALVLIVGMIVLYRLTRDYAWQYTHAPIVAAGYEVTVAPPAAHIAMERSSAAPPPLVQILPTTPQTFSAAPPPPIPVLSSTPPPTPESSS